MALWTPYPQRITVHTAFEEVSIAPLPPQVRLLVGGETLDTPQVARLRVGDPRLKFQPRFLDKPGIKLSIEKRSTVQASRLQQPVRLLLREPAVPVSLFWPKTQKLLNIGERVLVGAT
jgi:hypothetical protein